MLPWSCLKWDKTRPQHINFSFNGSHNLSRKLDTPNRFVLREVSHFIHDHTDDSGGENVFDEFFFVEVEGTLLVTILPCLCSAGPWHFQHHHHLCHYLILYFLMQVANHLTALCKALVSPNHYQMTYLYCDSLLLKWLICVMAKDSSHCVAHHWPGLFGSW